MEFLREFILSRGLEVNQVDKFITYDEAVEWYLANKDREKYQLGYTTGELREGTERPLNESQTFMRRLEFELSGYQRLIDEGLCFPLLSYFVTYEAFLCEEIEVQGARKVSTFSGGKVGRKKNRLMGMKPMYQWAYLCGRPIADEISATVAANITIAGHEKMSAYTFVAEEYGLSVDAARKIHSRIGSKVEMDSDNGFATMDPPPQNWPSQIIKKEN